MIGDQLELATSDAARIDDRIATACILVAERPDLVTGVWVCGLVRCGETFAGVRAAQLRWGVTITDESPNGSPAMTVRIRRPYDRRASLVDGHVPYKP
mgnify:CR=1 FL=1